MGPLKRLMLACGVALACALLALGAPSRGLVQWRAPTAGPPQLPRPSSARLEGAARKLGWQPSLTSPVLPRQYQIESTPDKVQ